MKTLFVVNREKDWPQELRGADRLEEFDGLFGLPCILKQPDGGLSLGVHKAARPLFVCRYFMAPGHWQIHKYEPGCHLEGRTEAVSVRRRRPS